VREKEENNKNQRKEVLSPLKCRVQARVRVTFSGHRLVNILRFQFVQQTYGPRLIIKAKTRKNY